MPTQQLRCEDSVIPVGEATCVWCEDEHFSSTAYAIAFLAIRPTNLPLRTELSLALRDDVVILRPMRDCSEPKFVR